ncbi:MAG: hypothetical protein QM796_01700 [Chthoniobacteraceae bacterium]
MKFRFLFNTVMFVILFAIVLASIALCVRTMVQFAALLPEPTPGLTQVIQGGMATPANKG